MPAEAVSISTPDSDRMRAAGLWNSAWDDLAAMDPAWVEKFMDMGTTPRTSRSW